MRKVFDKIKDNREFTRFDGWQVLIMPGEFEYHDNKHGCQKIWTMPATIKGLTKIMINDTGNDFAYQAPEVIERTAYTFTHCFGRGPSEIASPKILSFLEGMGFLSFVSAPIVKK